VLSGISGAGKSTLGMALGDYLTDRGRKVTIMDGDSLRKFFDGEFRYSARDRLMVSRILAYGAHLLSGQGIDVILATMLSQPGARDFLSKNVDFVEVFLDVKLEQCIQTDPKEVYKENLGKSTPDVVGYDLHFSRPRDPDLTIETHVEPPSESLHRIIEFLKTQKMFGM